MLNSVIWQTSHWDDNVGTLCAAYIKRKGDNCKMRRAAQHSNLKPSDVFRDRVHSLTLKTRLHRSVFFSVKLAIIKVKHHVLFIRWVGVLKVVYSIITIYRGRCRNSNMWALPLRFITSMWVKNLHSHALSLGNLISASMEFLSECVAGFLALQSSFRWIKTCLLIEAARSFKNWVNLHYDSWIYVHSVSFFSSIWYGFLKRGHTKNI